MPKDLARTIRRNRVVAMAHTGASPEAWAEVLLSDVHPAHPGELADLQAWCRRAAEEAENRRVIDSALAWVDRLADKEQAQASKLQALGPGARAGQLDAEQQWIQAQLGELPPPTRLPGWSLMATLIDLVQYAQDHPHPALNPDEWQDQLRRTVQQPSDTPSGEGETW